MTVAILFVGTFVGLFNEISFSSIVLWLFAWATAVMSVFDPRYKDVG